MARLPQGAHGVRTALNIVTLTWLVAEIWIRASRPAHGGQIRDRDTRIVILAGFVCGIGGAIAVANRRIGPFITVPGWPLRIFGIALGLAGIGLRVWAVRSLGRFFQLNLVVQDEHAVVRTGPYRVLRHPSYAGLILTGISLGLILDNWVSLALVTALPAAAMVRRIVVEERMLVESLGETYESYRRTTWRLVPGVW